jgi:hypothetical protein
MTPQTEYRLFLPEDGRYATLQKVLHIFIWTKGEGKKPLKLSKELLSQ